MKSQAETRLEVAKAKCEALKKEASAELENNENMQPMRSQEAKLKMNEVLQKMAKQGKFVVSGKTGQQVLDQFTRVIKAVDSTTAEEDDE